MSTDGKVFVFGGGVPCDPEINAWIQQHGMPKPGQRIDYSALELFWKVNRKQNRFTTLIGALQRKVFREARLLSRRRGGDHLLFLDGAGNVGLSVEKYHAGLRQVGKAAKIIEVTDVRTLAPEYRRAADHVAGTAAALRLLAATRAKDLPPLE